MPAEPDARAAAFFDIDNTLIHGASMFHWARGLAKHRYLTRGQILDFVWRQTRFVVVGKEHSGDVHDITEEALALVKGRNQAELIALTRDIFDEYMIDRFWPGTVALAQGHLDAGQRVWLVSAAPIELAELIAEHLGLSGALGTVSEQVHGVYTGKLVGQPLHGEAKAHAIQALAHREGLDLSRCAAYSDSANDIPMLSLVGTPVAVNPDRALRIHARRNGWTVRDYRTARRVIKITAPAVGAAGLVTGIAVGTIMARRGARG
ncbi:MAG TPA: HAD-IB family hydrolase [Actinomycetota bacterium]|nr:HAD-IB family hydrolase [Actinomycetota bacterium]